MAKEHLNRIAELRKARGLKQGELAEKLGIHAITLSKLERGKIQLHTGWMENIAEALGVHPVDLILDKPRMREIQISAELGDAGRLEYLYENENGKKPYEIVVPDTAMGADVGEWVIVETDSYWPQYHRGDKLFFVNVMPEQAAVYIGRLVVVQLEDEPHVAGYIIRCHGGRVVDLQVMNGRPVYDVDASELWVLVDVRFDFGTPTTRIEAGR